MNGAVAATKHGIMNPGRIKMSLILDWFIRLKRVNLAIWVWMECVYLFAFIRMSKKFEYVEG